MSTFNRARVRRIVCEQLRRTYAYRQALQHADDLNPDGVAFMASWVRVADELLDSLRSEPDGKGRVWFAIQMFGLDGKRQPMRYTYARAVNKLHVSEDGLKRWREAILFTASILAVKHGAIDLSNDA